LNSVRDYLLKEIKHDPSFIRIGVPFAFSLLRKNPSTAEDLAHEAESIWNSEYTKYMGISGRGRKRSLAAMVPKSPFPLERIAFSIDQMDSRYSKSIMVPLVGISSSYLSQFVACDLLKSPRHPDYFPTVLLSEILSKCEGPLYVGIRGRGYFSLA
jgi:hypothetical protein